MELGVDFPFKGGKSVNLKTEEGGKKMINQGKWKELGLNGYSSLEREIPAKTNFLAENPLTKSLKREYLFNPYLLGRGAFTSGTASPSAGGSAGAAALSAILGPLVKKYMGSEGKLKLQVGSNLNQNRSAAC